VCCWLLPGAESYGRIVFRKPSKRSTDSNDAVLSASSVTKKAKTKKDCSNSSHSSADQKTPGNDRTSDKAKPNSSLLSFNDDDDDDDDS